MSGKNTLYFRTICEEGTLLGAANRLDMTQPSLSKFLNQLEQELQVQLFERTKKGLVITEAGKAYQEYCSQFDQMYSRMRLQLLEISEQSVFNLKIGITPARGFYIIPELFPRFKALRPSVHLELLETTASELELLLVKREIHIALFTIREQSLPQGLLSYPICEEKIMLVINKDLLRIITLLCSMFICIYAPIDHHNKVLSSFEKEIFKKRTFYHILFLFGLMIISEFALVNSSWNYVIDFSIVTNCIIMVLALIKKKIE